MIYVVGIGSAGSGSLNARALGIIKRAGLLAGTTRFLSEFEGSGVKRVVISGGLGKVADTIEEFISSARKERRRVTVVVLATGDPLLFGIAGFIIKRFNKRGVTVLPNLSIVAEAFALIKEPRNNAVVISGHGRPIDELFGEFPTGNPRRKVAIFTDKLNSPAVIAREIIRRNTLCDTDKTGYTAYVIESIGTKKERVRTSTLVTLSRRKKFEALNILILIPKPALQDNPVKDLKSTCFEVPLNKINPNRIGLPDNLFTSTTGMITKAEVRVVALSKLDIRPTDVVWDIGAGCGSVSVEAARLAKSGAVIAFEKKMVRVKDIKENIASFGLSNVKVIKGSAPAVLNVSGVARPDRVFVGGGGGVVGAGIDAILQVVLKRIKSGGIVVVNSVTIETASRALAFFNSTGWHCEMAQISISRTKPVGGLNILSAFNPVFIITARSELK